MISSSSISNSNSSNGSVASANNSKKRKNVSDSNGNTQILENSINTISSNNSAVSSSEVTVILPTTSVHANSSSTNAAVQQLHQQNQPYDRMMFWQWNMDRIGSWIRTTGALFEKQHHQQHHEETLPTAAVSSEEVDTWVANMIQALKSACCQKQEEQKQHDKFHILDSTFSRGENVVFSPGAVVSRLNVGGWLNGLVGIEGGLVDPAVFTITNNTKLGFTKKLEKLALALHRATCAKLEIDMLESTPMRIVELLCPEVSSQEIANIRRRIYDTVVLGKGIHLQHQHNKDGSEEEEDLPVSSSKMSSEVEKWHKCKTCKNNDQSKFASDTKNGDLICTECGTVASENLMHEGSQFRKFEGELDRNHHGDAPNYLYSNAHNLSTTLGAGIGQATSFKQSTTSGNNGQMWGMSGGNKNMENILRNAHAYTEMNISQFGKDERRTRTGYKDRQKKDAFVKMAHIGDSLNLHDAVIQRSKELFAGFRDDRELVQQFKGVVAACLCEAFDQLSRDGRNILKVRAGDSSNNSGEAWNGTRATWRNAMHNTTAASKGSAFFTSSTTVNNTSTGTSATTMEDDKTSTSTVVTSTEDISNNELEKKPAATWDMDDVRTWLLQASRSIARQWAYLARNTTTADDGAVTTSCIPSGSLGSLDELEGKLVEYTFLLCAELEREEQNDGKSSNKAGGINKQRVHTPRVNDMALLGIKWQSNRERGSGGKGGVGNSGKQQMTVTTSTSSTSSSRTAGQRLILKTSKKLSSIVQDIFAGEAFHKELRNLLARQEERKKQDRMSENAHKRFQQMQRKAWIQKRLE